MTLEHSIVGRNRNDFSKEADQGSFVHTLSCMVGIVASRHVASNITFFTHVEDLVSDIKELTGATDFQISYTY
jgi:hypothetical protein